MGGAPGGVGPALAQPGHHVIAPLAGVAVVAGTLLGQAVIRGSPGCASAAQGAGRPSGAIQWNVRNAISITMKAPRRSVVPKHGISGTARQRALDTIDALGLSKRDLVNPRFYSIRKFKEGFAEHLTGLSFAERQGFVETFLKMHHEDRVDFLVYGASEKGESIEYPGLKAMVAEKLLRDNSF